MSSFNTAWKRAPWLRIFTSIWRRPNTWRIAAWALTGRFPARRPIRRPKSTTTSSTSRSKDTSSPFPQNLVPGWPVKDTFCVEPDYQQQTGHRLFVDKVLAIATKLEKKDRRFLFGGLAWDVPEVSGLFYANHKPTPLSHWTGSDSTAQWPGAVHQYKTYNEGKAAYFNTVKDAARARFPDRKLGFIFEPYPIYRWIADVEKLEPSCQARLFADALIAQESGKTPWSTGTEFVDERRIFKSGFDYQGSRRLRHPRQP